MSQHYICRIKSYRCLVFTEVCRKFKHNFDPFSFIIYILRSIKIHFAQSNKSIASHQKVHTLIMPRKDFYVDWTVDTTYVQFCSPNLNPNIFNESNITFLFYISLTFINQTRTHRTHPLSRRNKVTALSKTEFVQRDSKLYRYTQYCMSKKS